jgi:MYXO-CTERM domain-containing protein
LVPPRDAGVGEDAGLEEVDAAAFDAGPPLDAPSGPVVTFAGGSGCRCQVGHASPSSLAALVLLGLVSAVARRRR